jgi:predicted nucleic acid-binding protein
VSVEQLVHVVLDANVYIDAVCGAAQPDGFPPRMDALPALPPRRQEPALHVLGEIFHGAHRGAGPDHEDNLILDLAVAVSVTLIVSNDSDRLSLSRRTAWRGRPIISPSDFTRRAESAARRRRRH